MKVWDKDKISETEAIESGVLRPSKNFVIKLAILQSTCQSFLLLNASRRLNQLVSGRHREWDALQDPVHRRRHAEDRSQPDNRWGRGHEVGHELGQLNDLRLSPVSLNWINSIGAVIEMSLLSVIFLFLHDSAITLEKSGQKCALRNVCSCD